MNRHLALLQPYPFERLAALKHRYDPGNLFRHTKNVTS